MNDELIQKFKKRLDNLRDSVAKIKGVLEMDKDKVRADEALFDELRGRYMEVESFLKELEKE